MGAPTRPSKLRLWRLQTCCCTSRLPPASPLPQPLRLPSPPRPSPLRRWKLERRALARRTKLPRRPSPRRQLRRQKRLTLKVGLCHFKVSLCTLSVARSDCIQDSARQTRVAGGISFTSQSAVTCRVWEGSDWGCEERLTWTKEPRALLRVGLRHPRATLVVAGESGRPEEDEGAARQQCATLLHWGRASLEQSSMGTGMGMVQI